MFGLMFGLLKTGFRFRLPVLKGIRLGLCLYSGILEFFLFFVVYCARRIGFGFQVDGHKSICGCRDFFATSIFQRIVRNVADL